MNKTETPPEFARIQCACTNLKMASRVVGRAYDAFLAPFDLNVTQYAILVNVSRYQPVSQMKLAAHLNLERTTLYREVAPLAKKMAQNFRHIQRCYQNSGAYPVRAGSGETGHS